MPRPFTPRKESLQSVCEEDEILESDAGSKERRLPPKSVMLHVTPATTSSLHHGPHAERLPSKLFEDVESALIFDPFRLPVLIRPPTSSSPCLTPPPTYLLSLLLL